MAILRADRRYVLWTALAAVLLVIVAAWACIEPPWVEFISPGGGQVVSGDTLLEATPGGGGSASADSHPGVLGLPLAGTADPTKTARVDFIARGKTIAKVTTAPPWRTTWDTTKFHDGHCALKAEAYDQTGNFLGRSRTVHVTITNLVSIDEPTKREAVSGTAGVTGSVRDGVDFSEVRLYVKGKVVATATESPFSFEWDSTTEDDGEHILRVKAYKGKQQLGHAAVRVVVNNH